MPNVVQKATNPRRSRRPSRSRLALGGLSVFPLGAILASLGLGESAHLTETPSVSARIWTAIDSANRAGDWLAVDRIYAPLPGTIELSGLDGKNGFRVNGIATNNLAGSAVSGAGDVNGDGFDDILIGAYMAGPRGYGHSYVVYGSLSQPTAVNLSALNGTNGFRINGFSIGFLAGKDVSGAGDVNGDGFDDILIAAPGANPHADPNGNGAGQSYVVYGGPAIPKIVELTSLNRVHGFVVNGISRMEFTRAVSRAGDVNGDGFDDILIGGPGSDVFNDYSGRTYLVYGGPAMPGTIELAGLNGINGFRMHGSSGGATSGAGDVNGDGFDDILIGGRTVDQCWVVYGGSALPSIVELANLAGSTGFRINDIPPGGGLGFSVSGAGDMNGDGFDDILMAAPFTDRPGYSGQSYVVYGGSAIPGTVDLSTLDGRNGYLISGVRLMHLSPMAVSCAGDVNSDGFSDILVGAPSAGPNGLESGQTFLVYGASAMPGTIDASALDGTAGFIVNGITSHDRAGGAVSGAGDVNSDGFDDILIGASQAGPNGGSSGQSYVIYGDGDRPPRPHIAFLPAVDR